MPQGKKGQRPSAAIQAQKKRKLTYGRVDHTSADPTVDRHRQGVTHTSPLLAGACPERSRTSGTTSQLQLRVWTFEIPFKPPPHAMVRKFASCKPPPKVLIPCQIEFLPSRFPFRDNR